MRQLSRLALPLVLVSAAALILTACSRVEREPPVREDLVPPVLTVPAAPAAPPARSGTETFPQAGELDHPLTLADTIRSALLDNPGLRAEFAAFEATLQKIPQVQSLPDPMFTYAQFVDSIQTRTGEQEMILGIQQRFPWFGTLTLQGRMADADAQAALESYRINLLDVIQQTTKAYNQLAFEYAALELTEQEKTYTEQFLETATAAYATGQKGRQSVLKAQTEIARVENELLGFPARIRSLEAQLNRLMGRDPKRPFPRPEQIPSGFLDLESADFLTQALENRPELDRIDAMISRSRYQEQLARKDYWPDFMIGANYFVIGDRPDDPPAAPVDENDDAWNVVLGVSLPIPNARRRAQVLEAQHLAEKALLQREDTEQRIASDLRSNTERLTSLGDQLAVYEESLIPLAQETFSTSQSEYTAGRGSFLDLLDAERTLLRIRLNYLRVLTDYRNTVADLERTVGTQFATAEQPAPQIKRVSSP